MTSEDDRTVSVLPPDEGATAAPQDNGSDGAARRRIPWMPWTIAVLATILAIVSTLQWQSLRSDVAARDDVRLATSEVVTTLLTWDADNGLDDTLDRLSELGSGRFLVEAEDLLGSDQVESLAAQGARSEGTIEDLFVQSIEDEQAEAFAVLHQTIELAEGDPLRLVHAARVVLEREDGRWVVTNLELVSSDLAGVLGTEDGS